MTMSCTKTSENKTVYFKRYLSRNYVSEWVDKKVVRNYLKENNEKMLLQKFGDLFIENN